jgi:hypothetical protein
MDKMTRRAFGAAGFVLLVATSATFAQQQSSTVRVRGTVEGVDGPMLTVKSRDGQTTYKVKIADNVAVRGVVKASLSDIKQNSFIGVTGMPQADGSQKAVEIHIFPEALRVMVLFGIRSHGRCPSNPPQSCLFQPQQFCGLAT